MRKSGENVEIEVDLVGDGFSVHACNSRGLKHYVYDSDENPGKFAAGAGIAVSTVGTLDNVPTGASISEDCTI